MTPNDTLAWWVNILLRTQAGGRLLASGLRVRDFAAPGLGRVNFDISRGECVVLSGASGSGKSRLLRALADLDPAAGECSLDGMERRSLPAALWRRRVAYVPADSGWWAEQVSEHFCAGAEVDLDCVGLPADALSWPVARLSTGERQRLALLRALAREPDALLLDEPTANLDADTTALVEALVLRLMGERDLCIIWVAHDAAQSDRIACRVLRIADHGLHEVAAA